MDVLLTSLSCCLDVAHDPQVNADGYVWDMQGRCREERDELMTTTRLGTKATKNTEFLGGDSERGCANLIKTEMCGDLG